jgi:2,4-dienoyl-CoA reductase (NADPH2)
VSREVHPPGREITLLQRKKSKPGATLGKTTGWIHRAALKDLNVKTLTGVEYDRVDAGGLHARIDGKSVLIEADTVVVCAGQEPLRELQRELEGSGIPLHLIGGADVATELDAKRAIDQGSRLAARL